MICNDDENENLWRSLVDGQADVSGGDATVTVTDLSFTVHKLALQVDSVSSMSSQSVPSPSLSKIVAKAESMETSISSGQNSDPNV